MSAEIPNSTLLQTYRKRLWVGLGAALALRLVLILFPMAFWVDMDTFMAWSRRLVEVGVPNFYAPDYFCDYPPGYLYVLSGLGHLYHLFDPSWAHYGRGLGLSALLKAPAVLADVASAYVIFLILRGRVTIRSAYHGALVYAFNPLVLFVSGIWGQIDSVLTLAMLAAVWLLLRNRFVTAAATAVLGVMLKPQGLFLAPFFVLSQWFRRAWWVWPAAALAGFALVWALTFPFHAGGAPVVGPFAFLFEKMMATAGTYTSSTINAFNIWAPTSLDNGVLMWGDRYSDSRTIFGLTHRALGLVFVGILSAWMGVYLYRKRHAGLAPLMLASSLLLLGFFLFPTRMHERYMFPAIAFLTLAASANRHLIPNMWAFTATATLNVLYVYVYYTNQQLFYAVPAPVRTVVIVGAVLVNMWTFGDLVGYTFGRRHETAWRPTTSLRQALLGKGASEMEAESAPEPWDRRDWQWMLGLMGAFLALGLWRLGLPAEQIFDEVYHARTAEEYLKGISPYEWTHPPLAKLMIAVGVALFGMNAFGWRIVSLLVGALTLGVFYLLARRMLDRRRPAWIATLMLACDGVFFVQSRVAMTNIYVVFFLLLATLATWEFMRTRKERMLPLAALALGAALATRWSTMYAWGLLGLLIGVYVLFWEAPRRQPKEIGLLALRCIGYFVAIPVAVYLLSYIPYMAQGHGLGEVLQMQKNMWGYHANLNASHSYSSPWWQWPLMVRPTWYYYHDWKNGLISGIIAIGNPALWWASIPALLAMAYVAWRRKLWMGWFVVTMGLGMYLMWAIQPRPLVFMHYMFETIPFSILAMAYFMERLWRQEDWEPVASTYLALVVGLFAFFYPLLSGLPIPEQFYRMHIWFRTWI
ncbi:MAG TPA: phospholipid carrier-dependent glycosyltransferase [Pantanalinema sp.]